MASESMKRAHGVKRRILGVDHRCAFLHANPWMPSLATSADHAASMRGSATPGPNANGQPAGSETPLSQGQGEIGDDVKQEDGNDIVSR